MLSVKGLTGDPKPTVVGCDLGGTNFRCGYTDTDGRLHVKQIRTDTQSGPDSLIRSMAQLIFDLERDAGKPFTTIGIGFPGQINRQGIATAPNLGRGWESGISLGEKLETALGRGKKVYPVNDVRAAAAAEAVQGAAKGEEDVFYAFIGTGLGTATITSGQMLEGGTNSAGEWGHTTYIPDGAPCNCGSKGCVEAYAGGAGIAARAKEKIQDLIASKSKKTTSIMIKADQDFAKVDAKIVVEAYKEGDWLAIDIIEEAIKAICVCIKNAVHAVNPRLVVIGGSVGLGIPGLVDLVQQYIRDNAMTALKGVRVVAAKLEQPGVVGAAVLASLASSSNNDQRRMIKHRSLSVGSISPPPATDAFYNSSKRKFYDEFGREVEVY